MGKKGQESHLAKGKKKERKNKGGLADSFRDHQPAVCRAQKQEKAGEAGEAEEQTGLAELGRRQTRRRTSARLGSRLSGCAGGGRWTMSGGGGGGGGGRRTVKRQTADDIGNGKGCEGAGVWARQLRGEQKKKGR